MNYFLSFLVLFFSFINISSAATFNEIGDAGELMSTAQDTTGIGSLNEIKGSFINLDNSDPDFPVSDIDAYKINITNTSLFSVSMTANFVDEFGDDDSDPYLWLFDSAGNLVFDNDDTSGSNFLPSIVAGDLALFDSGVYYLAVSMWEANPLNYYNLAVSNLEEGWERNGFLGVGEYELSLTDPEISEVPIPAALWLFSAGLMTLIGARKKVA